MANYSNIKQQLGSDIECFIFDSIPSTNDYLSGLPFCKNTQVCITSEQTQGKGQYNRQWLSKKDASVLLSIRKVFPANVVLNGLSLVVGLAVIDVLEQYGAKDLKLKWPNDVYFNQQKLAGILIENAIQNQHQSVVIGLGLNNNLDKDFSCQTPWTDLFTMLNKSIDLTDLSAKLINSIIEYSHIFEQQGLPYFQKKWQQYDYLLNAKLELSYQNKTLTGVAKGISQQGALIIKTQDETVEAYSSEQIRLI